MSLSGGNTEALIARLIEAGTPAALVAEVAMELARAQAIQEIVEQRKAKDRERKRIPRNSTESEESAEFHDKGSLEVSPGNPLPKPSKSKPPYTPQILEGKKQAIGSCLRAAFPAPPKVSDEQWAAFRKQRKKPLNDRSYLLLCNKLIELAEAGWPPGEMIDRAIEHGWETVFAPRNQQHGKPASNITSLRGSRPDPALDLLRAARAAEDREDNWRAGPSLPALGSG